MSDLDAEFTDIGLSLAIATEDSVTSVAPSVSPFTTVDAVWEEHSVLSGTTFSCNTWLRSGIASVQGHDAASVMDDKGCSHLAINKPCLSADDLRPCNRSPADEESEPFEGSCFSKEPLDVVILKDMTNLSLNAHSKSKNSSGHTSGLKL